MTVQVPLHWEIDIGRILAILPDKVNSDNFCNAMREAPKLR